MPLQNKWNRKCPYIPYVIDIYGETHYGLTAIVYFDGGKSTIDSIASG
ncbi:MAG: hypothetical protein ACOX36_06480 [Saccharofermentanales bacterium]|jgi:hypothetical protein|nr:hypothetical protein [Clostridiaceae bacterium]